MQNNFNSLKQIQTDETKTKMFDSMELAVDNRDPHLIFVVIVIQLQPEKIKSIKNYMQ